MKKALIVIILFFNHVCVGQNRYKQMLDSLNYYFKQSYLTCNYSQQIGSLQLISKYHPAYVQTFVGDGTEVVTEKMKNDNSFFKAVSNNKKSVIVLSSNNPSGWVIVIDLKQIDSTNIKLQNDTVILSDNNKGFKSNVAHRWWKGYLMAKTVKIFPKNNSIKHELANKTYFFLRKAMMNFK